jgi:drug/metabolite transporter (DMT)-like permease
VLAVGLALSSSLVWGVADLVSAIAVRRFSVLAVALLSQVASVVTLAMVAGLSGFEFDRTGVLLALVAGCASALSISSFYKALEEGLVSLASPLLALGSVVAFALSVAAGERPTTVAAAGALLAVVGGVVTSYTGVRMGGRAGAAIVYGLLSAAALGFALYFVGTASQRMDVVLAVLCSRISASVLLALLAARSSPSLRIRGSWLAVIIVAGNASALALVLFGLAADAGLIAIAAVLSSLYPVVTIVLAHGFLGERLQKLQIVGIAVALAGIGLVTLGR